MEFIKTISDLWRDESAESAVSMNETRESASPTRSVYERVTKREEAASIAELRGSLKRLQKISEYDKSIRHRNQSCNFLHTLSLTINIQSIRTIHTVLRPRGEYKHNAASNSNTFTFISTCLLFREWWTMLLTVSSFWRKSASWKLEN